MKRVFAGLLALTLSVAPALAGMTGADETYDMLFRDGTLDALPRQAALIYRRDVSNDRVPEAADRATGQIELSLPGGPDNMAELRFVQGEKHRKMGAFPASVGNPMIMVFVESVIRDMAEAAGGSPFYIRNRVKDSLTRPADSEEITLDIGGKSAAAQTVTLRPFAGDPNVGRMSGFGDLVLTVTMSEQVPGWYHSLSAVVPGADGAPIYRSVTTFSGLEAPQ